jgi:hypothetical protein
MFLFCLHPTFENKANSLSLQGGGTNLLQKVQQIL